MMPQVFQSARFLAVCLALSLLCLAHPAVAQLSLEETNTDYSSYEQLSESEAAFQKLLNDVHRDDLFELIDRGVIRVLVTYSKTHYFVEQGSQHGLTYEMLKAFETYLNKRYKSRRNGRSLSVLPIPVARDELLEKIAAGQGELAVANLTITPDRKQLVDFSIPTIKSVKEVIVASAQAPTIQSLEDLSGKFLYIRESSSFFEHMQRVNREFEQRGLDPILIIKADEHLEVEDLMEMANANLIQYTIVDEHIADLWRKIFDNIIVYPNITVNEGGSIAWAVRKDTPNLIYEVNRFLKRHRSGTLFGNVVKKRYLENPYWAERALQEDDKRRYKEVRDLFNKYAGLYEFDSLMLMAQGYQESRLDHSVKSPAGAIGIMQVMPRTGQAMEVGDIRKLENNVHAGSKYLRRVIDRYFDDPEIDDLNRLLFAFAAYNAGPTRINKLRRKTEKLGLNPNIWFGNVEHTVARHIGREPVSYVANISKYFIAYSLIEEKSEIRNAVKSSVSEKS